MKSKFSGHAPKEQTKSYTEDRGASVANASTASDFLRDLVNDSSSSEAVELLSELLLSYHQENGKTDFLALIAPLAKDKAFAAIIDGIMDESFEHRKKKGQV